jgi:hypothetical protein
MKKKSGFTLYSLLILFVIGIVTSCKNDDPSILKVYVRDINNDLLPKAQVIIIGDTKSNPPTADYVDTLFTDALGVAVFDMEDFYKVSGTKVTSGFFDIIVKHQTKVTTSDVRVKKHITSVQTVRFYP